MKKEEGGDCVLLAMLVSHYSTAEFIKRQDNSHPRPYAAAFTHKDSHAARLMLLLPQFPLCMHVFVFISGDMCMRV